MLKIDKINFLNFVWCRFVLVWLLIRSDNNLLLELHEILRLLLRLDYCGLLLTFKYNVLYEMIDI